MSESEAALQAAALGTRSSAAPISRDNNLGAIESLLSAFALVLSLWAVALFSFHGELPPSVLILSVLVFALTFPGKSHLQAKPGKLVLDVTLNWLWVAGLVYALGLATGYIRDYSSDMLLTWLWAAPATELALHVLLRTAAPAILQMQGPPKRAIIVGMNEQGLVLAQRIRDASYSRTELVGFVDSREEQRLPMSEQNILLGKLEDISEIAKAQKAQLIYLSLPMASQPRILQLLDELKDTTASIYFVPDMFVTDLIQGHSGTMHGMPVISVCETPFRGLNGLTKRASDIVLSALILLLISPILLAVAITVKLTSPGPVIFKQRRYGLDGEEILVYKFRSMSVTEDGDKQYTQVVRGDARVTPFGAFIRKTSIDELPQFINVLQGRMSIVGPRPHAIAVNENYRKLIQGYMVRHKVKPGITGWAQVNGYRGGDDLDHMTKRIEFDLDYLRHWSLRLDIQIILKTVGLVAKDAQAH